MWFNNAQIFQCQLTNKSDLQDLLASDALKPCPPHARFTHGWMPPLSGELVDEVAGCVLICLGKEERLLPRSVVQRILEERVKAWETQQARIMKRADRAQLAEELEFELLPKSFCLQKSLLAYLDTVTNRLIVNTSSANQASQLTSLLRKSIPGIKIEPLQHDEHLAVHFSKWINQPNLLPSSFELATDCILLSPEDEKKRFNCKGYELPAEEILNLLSRGLEAVEVSMIWNERIQFTLTCDLTLKRIKCLDYLVDEFQEIRQLEEEYQQQDAAITLLSGELRSLMNDLLPLVSKKVPSAPVGKTEKDPIKPVVC